MKEWSCQVFRCSVLRFFRYLRKTPEGGGGYPPPSVRGLNIFPAYKRQLRLSCCIMLFLTLPGAPWLKREWSVFSIVQIYRAHAAFSGFFLENMEVCLVSTYVLLHTTALFLTRQHACNILCIVVTLQAFVYPLQTCHVCHESVASRCGGRWTPKARFE